MGRNMFLILGDVTHLVTVISFLCFIWKKRSSKGISGKTQILFSLVVTARYLDLFSHYISLYMSLAKVIYVAVAYVTTMTVYCKYTDTKREVYDTFRCEVLIAGAAVIAYFVNYSSDPLEVLWAFSEYLEAVAIIPQLFLVSKAGTSEKIVDYYIYGLAQYRTFYIVNWLYRYYHENHYDPLSTVSGVIQTLIYFDYFFALFSSHIISKYKKCNTSDPSFKDPVYIISSNDLPTVKENEKGSLIEKV